MAAKVTYKKLEEWAEANGFYDEEQQTKSYLLSYFKDTGWCDELEDLVSLGRYRGEGWNPKDRSAGVFSGYYDSIEFFAYPAWAKDILEDLPEELLEKLHENGINEREDY